MMGLEVVEMKRQQQRQQRQSVCVAHVRLIFLRYLLLGFFGGGGGGGSGSSSGSHIVARTTRWWWCWWSWSSSSSLLLWWLSPPYYVTSFPIVRVVTVLQKPQTQLPPRRVQETRSTRNRQRSKYYTRRIVAVTFNNNDHNDDNNNDQKKRKTKKNNRQGGGMMDLEELQEELLEYLIQRQKVGADEIAQRQVGRIIGGTKGNVVLDFVSGSPNKAQVLEDPPQVLDYDELTRYGYSHLVTPIMDLGGRHAVYQLLLEKAQQQQQQAQQGEEEEKDVTMQQSLLTSLLPPPPRPISKKKNISTNSSIVIDRTGALDPNRYTGLKLAQIVDDSIQAQALEQALSSSKSQTTTTSAETTTTFTSNNDDNAAAAAAAAYEIPFRDGRNIGPKQTPDWTPERLDEWGQAQGRVQAWARRSKAGQYVSDPYEVWDVATTSPQYWYSIVTAIVVAMAFGKSTQPFVNLITAIHNKNNHPVPPLSSIGGDMEEPGAAVAAAFAGTMITPPLVLVLLKGPAILLLLASLGSAIYSFQQAPTLNRNPILWMTKGWFGGPFTVLQLQTLNPLVTVREQEENENEIKKKSREAVQETTRTSSMNIPQQSLVSASSQPESATAVATTTTTTTTAMEHNTPVTTTD